MGGLGIIILIIQAVVIIYINYTFIVEYRRGCKIRENYDRLFMRNIRDLKPKDNGGKKTVKGETIGWID